MTFCNEVRREEYVCWKVRFEYPFILKLADGTLPIESLNYYVHRAHEQKKNKLKELFHKSYLYEWIFGEMAMPKQSWIPEGLR